MVTHAYRHFNGLKFGLISSHISSFIEIGPNMTKLSSEKAIFWLKSVGRDPWSPMHIGLLMDSTLGWYLPRFQVSLKLAEKWQSYRRKNAIFFDKNQSAVTHGHPDAYWHFYGLKFGLISKHISSFIEIGRKMTKLSSEKAVFSNKITQAWRVERG